MMMEVEVQNEDNDAVTKMRFQVDKVPSRRNSPSQPDNYQFEVPPRRNSPSQPDNYQFEVPPRRNSASQPVNYQFEVPPRRNSASQPENYQFEVPPRRNSPSQPVNYQFEVPPRRNSASQPVNYQFEVPPRRNSPNQPDNNTLQVPQFTWNDDDDDDDEAIERTEDNPSSLPAPSPQIQKRSKKISRQEAAPHEDHYRNVFSATHNLRMRPTLEQLHGPTVDDLFVEMVEEQGEPAAEDSAATKPIIKPPAPQVKFGWIQGVMVPTMLNIWGAMLFMRLPWIVGQSGVGLFTVIVLISLIVMLITAISMSAICTNGEVKGGGSYYLISRSLGPEFGGSIGFVFALASAGSVAMNLVGFAETVRDVMYTQGARMVDPLNDIRIIAYLSLILCVVIVCVGLEWVNRAQNILMFILIVAIVDFFVGSFMIPTPDKYSKGFQGWQDELFVENFTPDFINGESFFSVFGVFFTAATGILTGASSSSDLRDPQEAIPKGTLWAIAITTASYWIMGVACGFCCGRYAAGLSDFNNTMNNMTLGNDSATNWSFVGDQLSTADLYAQIEANNNACRIGNNCTEGSLYNFQMIQMFAGFGPLITAGIFAATISSALACFVSGPKVFQAVCNDHIFPVITLFGKGYGKSQEPIRSYALCFVVAAAFITIGDLNNLSVFISILFLMAYALVNYSCFDASLAKSPGWRPSFRYYSMWVSLFGFLLCMAGMFVMTWWLALLTFVLVGVLYVYVHYSKPDVNWGSSMQAHVYRNALQYAHKLVRVLDHVKNYRPQVLVLTGFPDHRPALVDFADCITKKQSFLSCGHVLVTDHLTGMRRAESLTQKAYDFLGKRRSKAFYSVYTAPTFYEGAQALLQSVGVGKLRPNTLIMGFKSDWLKSNPEDVQGYVNVVHNAFDLRFGVGILRIPEGFNNGNNGETEEKVVPATPETPKKHGRTSVSHLGATYITLVEDTITGEDHKGGSFFPNGMGDHLEKASPKHIKVESLRMDGGYHNPTVTLEEEGHRESSTDDIPTKPVTTTAQPSMRHSSSYVDIAVLGTTTLPAVVHPADDNNSVKMTPTFKQRFRLRRVVNESPSRYSTKQPKGTIDVYWLFDDGGLTILLPYILTQRKMWGDNKLRVFSVGSDKANYDSDQRHMATLLSKFRIDYASVTILLDTDSPIKQDTKQKFDESIRPYMLDEQIGETPESHPWKISKDDLEACDRKTNRHLRLREIIMEHSCAATLIVATLPMPRKGMVPASLYLAWLDALTTGLPPILLLRGNQQSVLTYYS